MVSGVAVTDPVILAGVVLTVLAAAFLATSIPAWRASRVPPATALTNG
jgi:ABC-type lipoprotein release transport system permease subunit